MSIFAVKSRMDRDDVHVTPPPPHVDLVHQLEAMVRQNSGQGTRHAVSQRLGLHTFNNGTRMVAGQECQKSLRGRVSSKEQLGLLSAHPNGGRQLRSGDWSQRCVSLGP